MFDRFAASAQRAVSSAGSIARYQRQTAINTGHLLFGVVSVVGQDLAPAAGDVILALGADPQSIRDLLLARLDEGSEPSPWHIPFAADVKAALEHAVSTADSMGSNHIGAEHLLAGLAGNPDSTAGTILSGLGITDATVIEAISRPAPESQTAARTCTVYLPVGRSIFKNGGKIHPDLASAQAAHPDQEMAPFAFQLADGEFFEVWTKYPRPSSWGAFASYRDAFAAAEELNGVKDAHTGICIMTPDVTELRGKDASGRAVVLGRVVEYRRVSMMSRLANTRTKKEDSHV